MSSPASSLNLCHSSPYEWRPPFIYSNLPSYCPSQNLLSGIILLSIANCSQLLLLFSLLDLSVASLKKSFLSPYLRRPHCYSLSLYLFVTSSRLSQFCVCLFIYCLLIPLYCQLQESGINIYLSVYLFPAPTHRHSVGR